MKNPFNLCFNTPDQSSFFLPGFNSWRQILSLPLMLFVFLAWSQTALTVEPAQRIELNLTGSSTVAPLAAEIAKKFEQQQLDFHNKNVRVDVQTGGSTRGIQDARRGLADIGMVSRALNQTELDLQSFTIALDGICLIVHSDNPVSKLSRKQIIDIYTGKILNWSEVGGLDKPITVVNKAEGRSTLELFLQHFDLKNSQIKPHVIIGDNQQGIKTLEGNINAIAYTSVGAAEYEAKLGSPIKRLPLEGVAATTENIKNGTYTLARPLNLVLTSTKKPEVFEFLEFAQSAQVSALVEAQFLVAPGEIKR